VSASQFLVGISGAVVGVVGWLMVGMYIQRRAHDRQARDAGRAVYFELWANRMTISLAYRFDTFGPLSRTTYERLLPELSTWLPVDELQALVLAYLGHGGYQQAANDAELPAEVRQTALAALLKTHGTAYRLLQRRVFTAHELATLNRHVDPEYARMVEAATEEPIEEATP
jgi:hypothetical protein